MDQYLLNILKKAALDYLHKPITLSDGVEKFKFWKDLKKTGHKLASIHIFPFSQNV